MFITLYLFLFFLSVNMTNECLCYHHFYAREICPEPRTVSPEVYVGVGCHKAFVDYHLFAMYDFKHTLKLLTLEQFLIVYSLTKSI